MTKHEGRGREIYLKAVVTPAYDEFYITGLDKSGIPRPR
jgi:hypothetical protein